MHVLLLKRGSLFKDYSNLCKKKQLNTYTRAILFMIWSVLSFTIMNLLLKYLVHYPTFELVFFRSLGTLVFTTLILSLQKVSLWGTHRYLLVARGLSGVTSMTLFFASLNYISLGSAVALRYVAPIFTAVIAVLFLKERMNFLQWLFLLLSFLGVLLVKGFDPSIGYFGFSLIMLCALFSAMVYIVINKIGTREHPLVVVHYFMLIATLVGLVGMLFDWVTPKTEDIIWLLSLGVFGFFGQYFMTRAFQIYNAHLVAPFKYVEVFFTLSFGLFIFGETYTLLSLVGTFCIIAGLVLNVIYKYYHQRSNTLKLK